MTEIEFRVFFSDGTSLVVSAINHVQARNRAYRLRPDATISSIFQLLPQEALA